MNQITTRRTLSQRTEGSREVLLVAKDRRIKELEAENRQLKEELKVARGKWYEQMETNR
jgi:cell shape-determining protein MreC